MSKARKVERTTKTQIQETNEPDTGMRNVTSSLEVQECSEMTETPTSARSTQQSCPRPGTSGGTNRTNTRLPLRSSPASTTMNQGFCNERSPNRTPPRRDTTQIFGTPRTPTKPYPGPPMFCSTPNRAGGKRPDLSLGGSPGYGDRLFGAEAPGDFSMPEVPCPVCIREEDQDMAAGTAMFDTTPKDFGHVRMFENDYSPLPRSPDKFDFTMIDTSYGSMYLPDRLMRGPRSPKNSGVVCQGGPARGTYEAPPRGTYSPPPRGTYTPQPRQQAPRGTYSPPQNAVCPAPPRGTYSPPQRAPPRGTYTPPERGTCPAPSRGTYSPPQRAPCPAPPRGTYSPAKQDTTYGSIPGFDDYSYKPSYNFTSPPCATLASEIVPPPSSYADNDSSFLPLMNSTFNDGSPQTADSIFDDSNDCMDDGFDPCQDYDSLDDYSNPGLEDVEFVEFTTCSQPADVTGGFLERRPPMHEIFGREMKSPQRMSYYPEDQFYYLEDPVTGTDVRIHKALPRGPRPEYECGSYDIGGQAANMNGTYDVCNEQTPNPCGNATYNKPNSISPNLTYDACSKFDQTQMKSANATFNINRSVRQATNATYNTSRKADDEECVCADETYNKSAPASRPRSPNATFDVSGSMGRSQQVCPDNTYDVSKSMVSSRSPCPANGTFDVSGSMGRSQSIRPDNTYDVSKSMASSRSPCPNGTFNITGSMGRSQPIRPDNTYDVSKSMASSRSPCPNGTFNITGSIGRSQSIRPDNTYDVSKSMASSRSPCPVNGTFDVSGNMGRSQSVCPNSTYDVSSKSVASSRSPCPANGTFDVSGSMGRSQSVCPNNTYDVSKSVASSRSPCPGNATFDVSENMGRSQSVCPNNTYDVSKSVASSRSPCPANGTFDISGSMDRSQSIGPNNTYDVSKSVASSRSPCPGNATFDVSGNMGRSQSVCPNNTYDVSSKSVSSSRSPCANGTYNISGSMGQSQSIRPNTTYDTNKSLAGTNTTYATCKSSFDKGGTRAFSPTARTQSFGVSKTYDTSSCNDGTYDSSNCGPSYGSNTYNQSTCPGASFNRSSGFGGIQSQELSSINDCCGTSRTLNQSQFSRAPGSMLPNQLPQNLTQRGDDSGSCNTGTNFSDNIASAPQSTPIRHRPGDLPASFAENSHIVLYQFLSTTQKELEDLAKGIGIDQITPIRPSCPDATYVDPRNRLGEPECVSQSSSRPPCNNNTFIDPRNRLLPDQDVSIYRSQNKCPQGSSPPELQNIKQMSPNSVVVESHYPPANSQPGASHTIQPFSMLNVECKRPPPGSYVHGFGSAYDEVFGKNAMNDTTPIIQRPDTSYEQMFSQRFPGHRPDQAMAMHSTQINEDVNLSRYDRPDFTREQINGNYQTPNNQQMDRIPCDSGNYQKVYKMGSFSLHDSDVPSKMLTGISKKSVRISEADYDSTGPICERDFSIDGDMSSVQSVSLLQSFDNKVKYELCKLSRQFEVTSPSGASSQRSTSIGDSSVSGHFGVKKHRPEMLRASGTAISIASAMRDCVDTDLLHIIDGFALAEAMCEYDAQVQAADEAAESAPIEMAEEAAIEGARNFRKDPDDKGLSKPEVEPQQLISVVAYVGSTRPAYNIQGFRGYY